MLPPRPLLALCVLLVGLLSWSVAARPLPGIPVADAARWEGQSVRVEGWVVDARGTRLTLADGGHALQVEAEAAMDPAVRIGLGDRVEASGRLTRWQGALRLAADHLAFVDGPRPVEPSWDDLAGEPDRWIGTLLRLDGAVERGRLVGERASVATGEGPWPAAGPVQVTGLIRFDPACLCHRLDAREVRGPDAAGVPGWTR